MNEFLWSNLQLIKSIQSKDFQAIIHWLENGAKIDQICNGQSALHALANSDDEKIVEQVCNFLDKNTIKIDSNICDEHSFYPIHYASLRSKSFFLNWLFVHGADISLTDQNGKSAFHFAISAGSSEIIDWLKGKTHLISLNVVDNYGYGLLEYCIIFIKPIVAQWLMSEQTIIQTHFNSVRGFCNKHLNLNSEKKSMNWVFNQNLNTMSESNMKPTAVEVGGDMIPTAAPVGGDMNPTPERICGNCVPNETSTNSGLILINSADAVAQQTSTTINGTSTHCASNRNCHNSEPCRDSFVVAFESINITDGRFTKYGTLWHLLAANPFYKPIEPLSLWLQKNKVCPNSLDQMGNSPLHLCSIHNNVELAQILLDLGANLEQKNFIGKSATDMVIKQNHSQTTVEQVFLAHKEAKHLSQIIAPINSHSIAQNAVNESGDSINSQSNKTSAIRL